MLAEWRGDTMGTTAHVVVDATAQPLLRLAEQRLIDWHRRWSRFDPGSEICALNRADGVPVVVGADTAALLIAAIDGWHITDGAFDPTVHDAVVAAGYDRPFRLGPGPRRACGPGPGPAEVMVDPESGLVEAPAGTRFDLGGIAKGHAADRLVEELLAEGAAGVSVTVGGDTAVGGACPFAEAWPIHLQPESRPIAHLRQGGFCLSTIERRRWFTPDGPAHHIIDPRNGRPAAESVMRVAVAAGSAEAAEVVATATIVDGPDIGRSRLARLGLTGFLVTSDGAVHIVDHHEVLDRDAVLDGTAPFRACDV